jgi:hypothetical protein
MFPKRNRRCFCSLVLWWCCQKTAIRKGQRFYPHPYYSNTEDTHSKELAQSHSRSLDNIVTANQRLYVARLSLLDENNNTVSHCKASSWWGVLHLLLIQWSSLLELSVIPSHLLTPDQWCIRIIWQARAGGMAQVLQHLSSKRKTLSSNPSTEKKRLTWCALQTPEVKAKSTTTG